MDLRFYSLMNNSDEVVCQWPAICSAVERKLYFNSVFL